MDVVDGAGAAVDKPDEGGQTSGPLPIGSRGARHVRLRRADLLTLCEETLRDGVEPGAAGHREKRHRRPLIVDVKADEGPAVDERAVVAGGRVGKLWNDHRIDLQINIKAGSHRGRASPGQR